MNRSQRNISLCSAGLSVLLVSSAVLLGSAMPPKILEVKEFSLIGIQARTHNAKEMTKDGVIPRQWNRFFRKESWPGFRIRSIPPSMPFTATTRATERRLHIFHRREGDRYFGDPCRHGREQSASGKVCRCYQRQRSGPERRATSVATNLDSGRPGSAWWPRSYKADFEVYDQRSRDPQDSQVDIYVGIK